jgi:putative transposase
MPRIARHAPGGIVYHVLNRANGRLRLFKKPDDFRAFEGVMLEAHRRVPIRILDWCIMGNHWHLALWPRRDGELTRFMRWLTLTHAQRWKQAHGAVGWGHLYQGRFKSLPVQDDPHLLTLLRYVHRNPVAAKLVRRAELWQWSSLWVRTHREHEMSELLLPLRPWPIELPHNWLTLVNAPLADAEEQRVRTSIERGRPYGSETWVAQTVKRLGLEQTIRPRGRPVGWRKSHKGSRHL